MLWRRRKEPTVDSLLYFVRATTASARSWAVSRQVPCWIEELPGGWVLLRTATVDGLIAGSSLKPEDALLEWATGTEAYALDGWTARGVRDGATYELDDDAGAAPWEVDDHRPVRGLMALRGDHSADLELLATARESALSAVIRDGWTLITHDGAMAPDAYTVDDPGLVMLRMGDELHLWLTVDGEPIAGWEWSVHGELAAVDRLPPGELGSEVRDVLYPGRNGVEPFQDIGMHPTPALVQALGSQAEAAVVVPDLVRALGLPDIVRAHLLGELDLAASEDALRVEPSSLGRAVAGSLLGSGRQIAASRSPRRRLWGAIGWMVFLPVVGLALTLLVQDLMSGREVPWWTWLRSVVLLSAVPFGLAAIRDWWVLRGTGQRDAAALPVSYRDDRDTKLGRWFNRRGPSTAVCLVLGLFLLGTGVYTWIDEAALRDRGIHTTAQVVGFDENTEETTAVVEFTDQQGRSVQVSLGGELVVGETVQIVVDPDDTSRAVLADDSTGPVVALIFGVLGLALLVVAALTWTRVIDWQRVSDWIH